jgi:hypothetical protein
VAVEATIRKAGFFDGPLNCIEVLKNTVVIAAGGEVHRCGYVQAVLQIGGDGFAQLARCMMKADADEAIKAFKRVLQANTNSN